MDHNIFSAEGNMLSAFGACIALIALLVWHSRKNKK